MAEPEISRPWRSPYGPVTIAELTAGLVWPMLFKAPGLALHWSRLAVGLMVVAALWVTGWIFDLVCSGVGIDPIGISRLQSASDRFGAGARSLLDARWTESAQNFYGGAIGQGLNFTETHALAAIVLFILFLIPWVIGGGAIARMTALDFAYGIDMSARSGIVFASRRLAGLMGAIVVPLATIGIIAALASGSAWVALSIPLVNVIGACLYIVVFLGALAAMLLALGFALGQHLLIPAVVIEGTDATDAIQRAYAYLFGRPGRTLVYTMLALIQLSIFFLIARWVWDNAGSTARYWLPEPYGGEFIQPGPDRSLVSRIIASWGSLLELVFAGVMVSLYHTTASLLYLAVRRINDEQDVREIWMPGLIPGSRATDPL